MIHVGGAWVEPLQPAELPVVSPATGEQVGVVALGGTADADRVVAAAREEIFGPVPAIMPCRDRQDAVRSANETSYGLSAHVWSGDDGRASRIARRLRAGMVHRDGAPLDNRAPLGRFRQSGNGRKWGKHGVREFVEV